MGTSSSSDLIQLRAKLVGGDVVVTGTNKISKSVTGLGKATSATAEKQKYADRVNSRLTTSYKKVGQAAKWGLGFLGVGGVLAIKSSIHATEELGKTTSALTRNFGLQNNVASRWAAVASSREIDSKALSMSFGTLSTKMVEAGRKGGTLLTPFHQLGISQEEVQKGARNFEWGLMRITKALGEEEGGAKRSAAAKGVLGKSYLTLAPLMADGVKGLQEQLQWADKYGVTLSGTTTSGIMEMVQAQRENKVAMLGLQVSLTKALMPAIHKGDEELQTFIATLNSPHLTAEQKMEKISEQFNRLEGYVVKAIEQALPSIAEHAGQLGVAMAGATVHGFTHADIVGKVAIGAFVFNMLGGQALVMAGAKKVGQKIGMKTGGGIATGILLGIIGYEVWQHLSDRSKEGIQLWGKRAGEDFVNALVGAINWGIDEINKTLDEANALAIFGVDAPNIHHVGEADFGGDVFEQEVEAKKHFDEGLIEGPGGKLIRPPKSGSVGGHHHGGQSASKRRRAGTQGLALRGTRPRLLTAPAPSARTGSGRPIVVHLTVQSILDGKAVAESTTKHSLDAAALG